MVINLTTALSFTKTQRPSARKAGVPTRALAIKLHPGFPVVVPVAIIHRAVLVDPYVMM
jgi:hypothetical protein